MALSFFAGMMFGVVLLGFYTGAQVAGELLFEKGSTDESVGVAAASRDRRVFQRAESDSRCRHRR